MQKETLKVYPLFLGLTRPPMIFGVTQSFFVFNFLPCMIVFFMTLHAVLSFVAFVIFHFVGVACCLSDAFVFSLLFGKLELMTRNHLYWGCNSYDPS